MKFPKKYFYKHVHRKVHLSSFSPNEGNQLADVLWYWKLAELQDHSSLESCSWSQSQVILLRYSIECYTEQKSEPLAWRSTVDPSGHFDYSYAYVYSLQLEYFVVEIHHGDFLIFLFTSKRKEKKASFHNSTPKTLILACACVDFFPVLLLLLLSYYYFPDLK